MDEAAWTALAITLTVVGGLVTVWAWRRRGAVPAMRAAALTLLVPAAYLTGTLEMFTRIVDAVGDWAFGLVLSPVVWIGAALAGTSVLLLVGAGLLDRRSGSRRVGRARRDELASPEAPAPADKGGKGNKGKPAIDDDLADIEALLRKRGIS